jgi:hypothetical protein
MPGLVADNDVEGHLEALHQYLLTPAWKGIWDDLGLSVETFATLGLPRNSPDRLIWETCQARQLMLVTGNRNDDGPDSLEATLRDSNQVDSFPVFTLSRPRRIRDDRAYLARAAEKLLEYLISLEHHRDAGRLYIP